MDAGETTAEELRSAPCDVPVRPARELLLLLAAAAALQAIAWVVIFQVLVAHKWGYVPSPVSDSSYYAFIGYKIVNGQWPYVDFAFEYPPLAALLFVIPPLRGTLGEYQRWFSVEMIALGVLTAIVTAAVAARMWDGLGRPLAAAAALGLAVVAAGAIAVDRFDGAVALVLALALLCMVHRRFTLAGFTVGIGFSLKLMPIVLLPLVLVLARTRRCVAWALAAAAAGALIPFLPFLVRDAGGVKTSLLVSQVGRGLQIESVAASPYLVAQLIRPGAVTVTVPLGGSLTVNAAGTRLVDQLAPLMVFILLVLVYWAVWRSREALRADSEGIPVVALAALLATMCGNKVLSPQHLLWVLPPVALCLVGRLWLPKVAALLVFVALVLTQVEYPGMYYRQMRLDPVPLAVISIRNAVLVAAFVVAVAAIWRLKRQKEEAVGETLADTATAPYAAAHSEPTEVEPGLPGSTA